MAFETRYRPLIARRAFRAMAQNPDDTAQAIRAIAAFSGNSGKRLFKRFRHTARGQQILREKPDLFALMSDVDRLKAMPPGSLGRAIGDWFSLEEISAQGLVDASTAAFSTGEFKGRETSGDEQFFSRRVGNLHDIFHVLAGYGRDLRGEIGVLTFSVPQTRNTGVAYMVLRSLRRVGWRSKQGRFIREAFSRGRRAEWLVDQPWESLLEQPIDEVRAKLGVGNPPVYEQVRSAGAPVLTT